MNTRNGMDKLVKIKEIIPFAHVEYCLSDVTPKCLNQTKYRVSHYPLLITRKLLIHPCLGWPKNPELKKKNLRQIRFVRGKKRQGQKI